MEKTLPQVCEFCFKKPAEFITYARKHSWKFCCQDCEEDIELYWIPFRRLINEDWVTHLSEKNWFNETKEEFLKRYNYAIRELVKKIDV